MKKLLGLIFCTLTVTGCDGLTDREESCLDNGGKWEDCTYEGRKHQQQMARIEARLPTVSPYDEYDYDYPEVESGHEYTNHYGDTRYGGWSNGHYRFTNPHGIYASSTNSFLIGAGVGGILGYMGTKAALRSNWNTANPNGYKSKRNSISKKDLAKRKDQSRKDKAKYRKQKAKKQTNKSTKTKVKKQKLNTKVKQKVGGKKSVPFAKKSVFAKSKLRPKQTKQKRRVVKRKSTKRKSKSKRRK